MLDCHSPVLYSLLFYPALVGSGAVVNDDPLEFVVWVLGVCPAEME